MEKELAKDITIKQSTKAMLKRKVKFISNMDRFSSRKNAYKKGWKDCYIWMMSKLEK